MNEKRSKIPNKELNLKKSSKITFYTKVLNEAEAIDFESAAETEGLDSEIALLRIKIKSLLQKEPGRSDKKHS